MKVSEFEYLLGELASFRQTYTIFINNFPFHEVILQKHIKKTITKNLITGLCKDLQIKYFKKNNEELSKTKKVF